MIWPITIGIILVFDWVYYAALITLILVAIVGAVDDFSRKKMILLPSMPLVQRPLLTRVPVKGIGTVIVFTET